MTRIQCDKCQGAGKIQLPADLQSTLAAIRSGLRTTKEIYRRDPNRKFFGQTAVNNRLERLRALGLITRVRLGKFITYSEVK